MSVLEQKANDVANHLVNTQGGDAEKFVITPTLILAILGILTDAVKIFIQNCKKTPAQAKEAIMNPGPLGGHLILRRLIRHHTESRREFVQYRQPLQASIVAVGQESTVEEITTTYQEVS